MRSFTLKMTKIVGLQYSPGPLAGLRGLLLRGKGKGWKGKEKEGVWTLTMLETD